MLGFDPKIYAVFEAWDRETQGLIKGCEAVALQGSILCISVPSVLHRQELLYSKERLIRKLNQALGGEIIKDIQFELKGHSQKGGVLSEQGRHGKNIG